MIRHLVDTASKTILFGARWPLIGLALLLVATSCGQTEPESTVGSTDDVTIELFTTGGDTNFITVPLNSYPESVIDGEGMAWKRSDDAEFGAATPKLVRKQLSPATRQAIVGLVENNEELFEPEVDFGYTDFNDQLDTSLTVTIDGQRQSFSLYDLHSEGTSGDKDAREAAQKLIADIQAAIDTDAAQWEPAMTETILVITASSGSDPAFTWPEGVAEPEFDQSIGYGCDSYSGDERQLLVDSLLEKTDSDGWSLSTGTHVVTIRPVFFEPDCERALRFR